MKDPIRSQYCAEKLHALAAPERLRIICLLQGGPLNVSEIAEKLGTNLVNASHHITVLRQARFLQRKKCGRFVYYSLAPRFLRRDQITEGMDYFDLGCCKLQMPRACEDPR
jgi:DNA-binding transcriptional ArsR family regulator